jgi:hypothetical protein
MTITRMRRNEVKTEGRDITKKKKSMKIFYVNHVRALLDNYTRRSARHTYSNKEGSQEKKNSNKTIILIDTKTLN